ncbi:hypothetical protein RM780_14490 [Streptomyces sp. DSM 44917]|uniref:Uncharacterized protein n=1 Tax=Streptomyces boetiae TaxID=3075541 RepID=A0ABU2L9B2_9ACTN|nr:hypothetical protein [Streptomyces sp. DSM 44917]MDT0308163.1 hypothetical protein [Streptomyces sp. DSM 44917]
MARLRHTIVLAPVGRQAAQAAVAQAHEVLESLTPAPGPGGTLLAPDGRPVVDAELRSGEHLRPGARYRVATGAEHAADAEVLAWDRGRETALRVLVTDPETGGRMVNSLRLRSADRPEHVTVTVDGGLVRPDGRRRRLRWMELRGQLDLPRWWGAAEGAPGHAALIVDVRLPVLRAEIRATPHPGADGTWRVEVRTVLRGRGLARPVAAVPLRVTRRMLHRALGQALERGAHDWGTRVVPELRRPPEEFRKRLLDELCAPRTG